MATPPPLLISAKVRGDLENPWTKRSLRLVAFPCLVEADKRFLGDIVGGFAVLQVAIGETQQGAFPALDQHTQGSLVVMGNAEHEGAVGGGSFRHRAGLGQRARVRVNTWQGKGEKRFAVQGGGPHAVCG